MIDRDEPMGGYAQRIGRAVLDAGKNYKVLTGEQFERQLGLAALEAIAAFPVTYISYITDRVLEDSNDAKEAKQLEFRRIMEETIEFLKEETFDA